MRQLNEYCKTNLINEYLSTKVNVTEEFPTSTMLDDILNFEELTPNRNSTFSLYDFKEVASKGKRTYSIYDNTKGQYVIYFCFDGKITIENPLFILCIQDGKRQWALKQYFNENQKHTTYTYNTNRNNFDAFFKDVNNKL